MKRPVYVRTCLYTAVCSINCCGNLKANRIIQGHATQRWTNKQFKYLHREHQKETQISINTRPLELSVHTQTAPRPTKCSNVTTRLQRWHLPNKTNAFLAQCCARVLQDLFKCFLLFFFYCKLSNTTKYIHNFQSIQLKHYIRFLATCFGPYEDQQPFFK